MFILLYKIRYTYVNKLNMSSSSKRLVYDALMDSLGSESEFDDEDKDPDFVIQKYTLFYCLVLLFCLKFSILTTTDIKSS